MPMASPASTSMPARPRATCSWTRSSGSSRDGTHAARRIPGHGRRFPWSSRTRPSCGGDHDGEPGPGTWATDPTWNWGRPPASLWFPHVYMPNQNPWDMTGRQRDGPVGLRPWFWPPVHGPDRERPGHRTRYDPASRPWEPPDESPARPTRRVVPEAFMDTPSSTARPTPTLQVEPKAVPVPHPERLQRPLPRTCQLYVAADQTRHDVVPAVRHPVDPAATAPRSRWCRNRARRIRTSRAGGPATWADSTFDDRAGGVPDPTTRRPGDDPDRHRGRPPAAPVVLPNHAGRLRATTAQTSWSLNVSEQHALPRAGGAGGRHRRLLGVRRQDPDPLQRRARAGPGRRPAHRLLHGRPGPDRHGRRAHDPAGLRSQHPDHHADPGGGPAARAPLDRQPGGAR